MKSKLSRFLRRVQQTREQEINCSECLDQISRYVDLELSAGVPERTLPQVRQHLEQCTVCQEEYQLLRDLARLETSNQPPTTGELITRLKRPSE